MMTFCFNSAVDSASPPLTATGTLTALIADYDEFTPDFTGISTCGAIESTSLESKYMFASSSTPCQLAVST